MPVPVSEREPLYEFVQIGCQRGFLLLQIRLPVAQGSQLLLVRIELARVVLHLLLLSADVVQALDIAADAVFVGGQIW